MAPKTTLLKLSVLVFVPLGTLENSPALSVLGNKKWLRFESRQGRQNIPLKLSSLAGLCVFFVMISQH